MSKLTISRLFFGSLIALAGGLVLLVVPVVLAVQSDALVMDGPDVVGVRSSPASWVMIISAVVAVVVLVAAAVTQFVAWVAAVLHTAQFENKTWFLVLLIGGLLSFGFIAMLVYILAGPDDPPSSPAGGPAPPAGWPSWQAPSPNPTSGSRTGEGGV
jgi:hypothetical protein